MKRLLIILAALFVLMHPQAVIAAELVALAVIAAGIARSAGVTIPINWRPA